MILAKGENWIFSYNNTDLIDMNNIIIEIDKIINKQSMDIQALEQVFMQYKTKNRSSKDFDKIFKLLDDIVRRCKKELSKSKPKLEKIKKKTRIDF